MVARWRLLYLTGAFFVGSVPKAKAVAALHPSGILIRAFATDIAGLLNAKVDRIHVHASVIALTLAMHERASTISQKNERDPDRRRDRGLPVPPPGHLVPPCERAAGSMGFVASGKQSITSFCGEGDHGDGGPT